MIREEVSKALEKHLVGLVSKARLAADIGVKERTIETWRTQGMPGNRVGKAVLYDPTEVRRWLEAR